MQSLWDANCMSPWKQTAQFDEQRRTIKNLDSLYNHGAEWCLRLERIRQKNYLHSSRQRTLPTELISCNPILEYF